MLRTLMDEASLASAWQAGCVIPVEQAIAEALGEYSKETVAEQGMA
jgi:hypothetical protein